MFDDASSTFLTLFLLTGITFCAVGIPFLIVSNKALEKEIEQLEARLKDLRKAP